jgi:DNA repair photolyase
MQTKRWRKHIQLIDTCLEEDPEEEEIDSIMQELRKLNRRISELHEDWFGLNANSDEWIKMLNYFDQTLLEYCSGYVEEETMTQYKKYEELQKITQRIQELSKKVILG